MGQNCPEGASERVRGEGDGTGRYDWSYPRINIDADSEYITRTSTALPTRCRWAPVRPSRLPHRAGRGRRFYNNGSPRRLRSRRPLTSKICCMRLLRPRGPPRQFLQGRMRTHKAYEHGRDTSAFTQNLPYVRIAYHMPPLARQNSIQNTKCRLLVLLLSNQRHRQWEDGGHGPCVTIFHIPLQCLPAPHPPCSALRSDDVQLEMLPAAAPAMSRSATRPERLGPDKLMATNALAHKETGHACKLGKKGAWRLTAAGKPCHVLQFMP